MSLDERAWLVGAVERKSPGSLRRVPSPLGGFIAEGRGGSEATGEGGSRATSSQREVSVAMRAQSITPTLRIACCLGAREQRVRGTSMLASLLSSSEARQT